MPKKIIEKVEEKEEEIEVQEQVVEPDLGFYAVLRMDKETVNRWLSAAYVRKSGVFYSVLIEPGSIVDTRLTSPVVNMAFNAAMHTATVYVPEEYADCSFLDDFKPVEKSLSQKQEISLLNTVSQYLAEGKKYEARNMLSDLFISGKIPEKQKEIQDQLDKLNEEIIFSPLPFPDAIMYTVQSGDILARIAKRFNTNYELIMKINGIAPNRLNFGDQLKILTGKTKILISKRDFTLLLLLNDKYVKQYRVATGKQQNTGWYV